MTAESLLSRPKSLIEAAQEAFAEMPEEEREKLQKSVAKAIAGLIIGRLAAVSLSRLTTRAHDAGFRVPALTRQQAGSLYRPAAFLAAAFAHRATLAAETARRDRR